MVNVTQNKNTSSNTVKTVSAHGKAADATANVAATATANKAANKTNAVTNATESLLSSQDTFIALAKKRKNAAAKHRQSRLREKLLTYFRKRVSDERVVDEK